MGEHRQLSNEASIVAWMVLFKPGVGLNAWDWYRAALPRMLDYYGRNLMLHEARQEAHRLLHEGATWKEAAHGTEAYLRGLWRPLWSHQSSRFEPATVPLHSTDVVDETDRHTDPFVVEQVKEIRLLLTPRQWELIVTFADCGSQSEAARLCGTKRQAVHRALTRARELVDTSVYALYEGEAPCGATARDLKGSGVGV